MRAVHFGAIWLEITAQAPDSFQTLCARHQLLPLPRRAPRSSTGDLPFVPVRGGGLSGTVTTFLQIADHLVAFSQSPLHEKASPWVGTMSRITLLVVAPRLELIFPQTPVPKLDRFEKTCSQQHSNILTNTRCWGSLEICQGLNCLPLHLLYYWCIVPSESMLIVFVSIFRRS